MLEKYLKIKSTSYNHKKYESQQLKTNKTITTIFFLLHINKKNDQKKTNSPKKKTIISLFLKYLNTFHSILLFTLYYRKKNPHKNSTFDFFILNKIIITKIILFKSHYFSSFCENIKISTNTST